MIRALVGCLVVCVCSCQENNQANSFRAEVRANLEERLPSGVPYTPATQSFLRGEHELERVHELEVTHGDPKRASIELHYAESETFTRFAGIELSELVPRLRYPVSRDEPDAFDALNLMLAEYSRNGLSVPHGNPGDEMAHFESNLTEGLPWELLGDYEFKSNPTLRPIRLSVVNNCLRPGLWELSASDNSGEIYHAWFDYPEEDYLEFTADQNGLALDFVRQALEWSTSRVPLDLARLRIPGEELGAVTFSLNSQEDSGYSSQGSRRKLSRGFAQVFDGGEWQSVTRLAQLTESKFTLAGFVEPGRYSLEDRKEFELSFLRDTRAATVRRVEPLTRYRHDTAAPDLEYIELELEIGDHVLVIGNLPLNWIVPQEDFEIHGFGVGVLAANGLAERRRQLMEGGPAPSYAYLCERDGDGLVVLNSHMFGLEQIFLRAHLEQDEPWWELTLTSYERIVDLVKFRIAIPKQLQAEVRRHAEEYVAPLCFTYRDDNLR